MLHYADAVLDRVAKLLHTVDYNIDNLNDGASH